LTNGSKAAKAAATTALRWKVHLHAGCDDISRTHRCQKDTLRYCCVGVLVCERSQTPIDNDVAPQKKKNRQPIHQIFKNITWTLEKQAKITLLGHF